MSRVCKKCELSKDVIFFEKGRAVCKDCRQKQKTEWTRDDRKDNAEKYNTRWRSYYSRNKEKVFARVKNYRTTNANLVKKMRRKYYLRNRNRILGVVNNYTKLNRKTIRRRRNIMRQNRRKVDAAFRLRDNLSRSIREALKKSGSMKNNVSCLKFLPYSIQELKTHLEKQFESWMNWQNWGKYDPIVRTWQIDHIVPQASLSYISMTDKNFEKCWALDNLRPLSAKQNMIDGTSRSRHRGSK